MTRLIRGVALTILLTLVGCVCCIISPCEAAISVVQSASNATGFASSLNVTVSALTTGNLVIATARIANKTLTMTPSATNVTFNSVIGPTDHSTQNIRAQMWWGTVDSGGATTITITLSSSSDAIHCSVIEASGLASSNVVDQSGSGQSGSATSSHDIAGTLTTTQASELLVGAACLNGSPGAYTAGSGYTKDTNIDGHAVGMQYQIVSATGNYSTPITDNSGSFYDVTLMGTFMAAGSTVKPKRLTLLGVGE